MTSKTKVISYDNRARIFLILVAVLILSFFVYIYAAYAITRNTALRQNLERQIANASTDLNSLEFAYIKLKNNVTIELAYLYGFQEAKNQLYVSRARPASLTFNTLDR